MATERLEPIHLAHSGWRFQRLDTGSVALVHVAPVMNDEQTRVGWATLTQVVFEASEWESIVNAMNRPRQT